MNLRHRLCMRGLRARRFQIPRGTGIARGCGILLFCFAIALTFAAHSTPLDGKYLCDWLVTGPFDAENNTMMENTAPFETALKSLVPKEGDPYIDVYGNTTHWAKYNAPQGIVDFAPLLKDRTSGFFLAHTSFVCETKIETVLLISHAHEMPAFAMLDNSPIQLVPQPRIFRLDTATLKTTFTPGTVHLFILGFCQKPHGRFAIRFQVPGGPDTELPTPLLQSGAIPGVFLHPTVIRYRIGDDPKWALPETDDSDWMMDNRLKNHNTCSIQDETDSVIWYRFRIRLAPGASNNPMVMEAYPHGTGIELYANGYPLGSPQFFRPPWPEVPRLWTPASDDLLIAVRWDRKNTSRETLENGFSLLLRGFHEVMNEYTENSAIEWVYGLHRIILTIIFALLFIFHSTLFVYLPKRREYLWFSLVLAACFGAILSLHISDITMNRTVWRIAYSHLFFAFTCLSILFGLGLLQTMFIGRITYLFYVYFALGVTIFFVAQYQNPHYAYFLPAIISPAILWILFKAIRNNRPGSRTLMGCMVFIFILILVHALGSLYDWPESSGFLRYSSWYSFAVFALLVALLLARDFANASKQLESFANELDAKVKQRTAELENALANVKTLSGLLPICAECKKIRDDSGYWRQIESYISSHSEAHFTHGMCPECTEKFYEEMGKNPRLNISD